MFKQDRYGKADEMRKVEDRVAPVSTGVLVLRSAEFRLWFDRAAKCC